MPSAKKSLEIHKFGGASLADAASMAHAVAIIQEQPKPLVVVVSAMSGVTDALLEVAHLAAAGNEKRVRSLIRQLRRRHELAAALLLPSGPQRRQVLTAIAASFDEMISIARGLSILRELTPRTSDYILARGERLSARLVAAALAAHRVRSQFVDAAEAICTDGHYGGASPELGETDRCARKVLRPFLQRGILPVVPGFLGRTPEGYIATLGRGGSDLTATLLARALKASAVILWKDVPGLLTADPRVVADARVIPQMTAREAAELAYYGAKVLHPRSLIPIGELSVPVRIRPFADPAQEGTEISRRRTLRNYPVKAISSMGGQALVTVTGNGMLGVPGIAARTFEALHREGLSVSLISQASSEHSICFSVPESGSERARRALVSAFRQEIAHREIDGVEIRQGMATLAIVGQGLSGTPGVTARIFEALAGGGINVVAIAQGSSELNISVVVDARDAAPSVRRIHSAFQLNRIGGGRVTRGERVDIVLLGFGQIGRKLSGMIAKSRQNGVVLRIVGAIDRSGWVFDQRGLSQRRLATLVAAKSAGQPLAAQPGGRAASALEALAEIARHALSRPVLVDVTAEETLPALKQALSSGMDLVLANKRPLTGSALQSRELLSLADAQGRRILHETTVGAGLPIIDTFYKLVESGDRVLRIEGCTSGTLGFLLDGVEQGRLFSEVLLEAARMGYTEPDPRDDLSGMDVARKALIMGRLIGYGGELADVQVESLVPESLRAVSREQFLARLPEADEPIALRVAEARAHGKVLRYIASVTRRLIQVRLQAVEARSPFAALKGTDNQVVFTTTRYRKNPLVITGPGAGPAVTAAGVLNDLLQLAGN